MLLVTHIIIALTSLVVTGGAYLSPSKARLRASYGLVAATIASGTYLIISTHAALVSACTTGLIYLAIAFSGIIMAHRKLASQKIAQR